MILVSKTQCLFIFLLHFLSAILSNRNYVVSINNLHHLTQYQTVAPSFDHFLVNTHLLRPLYLSYTDTNYAWFSFLCVLNLHSTNLNIHFTIYYVSWRVWFLDLQTVTYIFTSYFILPFSFSFFSLIAMIPLISPLCISLLSSCFQMLLLSSLSSWCYLFSSCLSSPLFISSLHFISCLFSFPLNNLLTHESITAHFFKQKFF